MATKAAVTRRRQNPLEKLEADIRTQLESAVNIFGFAGVLDMLADEASERSQADPDDEGAEFILNTLEAALEEIEGGVEEDEDAEPADDDGAGEEEDEDAEAEE